MTEARAEAATVSSLDAAPAVEPRRRGAAVADVIAGISVALLLVPQSLAYAALAGLPPVHGLYAAILPPVAAALFASSPYLQTGPVALTGLLTLGALHGLAPIGTPQYATYAALLALVVGVVRIGLGLLRAGVIGYLLSVPAVSAFTTGGAVLIVASQLPTLLAVRSDADNPLVAGISALRRPGEWDWASLALGLGVIAIIRLSRRIHPMVPGVLVATVAALVLVRVVGPIGPSVGALDLELPPSPAELPWTALPEVLLSGLVIAVVGFAEPASIARRYASLERQRWNPAQELVSQGVANIASGLSAGLPVGGSFSRTAMNRMAGARTRWSGAVTGLAVLALLPLAGVLASLPRAVLAGLVISAVTSLIDLPALRRFWQLSPAQGVVALGTLMATLVLAPHLERAVLIGVGLAMAVHLWRELHLPVQASVEGTTLRLCPAGVLYFASAPAMEDTLLDVLAAHPSVERIEIDLSGLGRIDLSGMLALRAIIDDLSALYQVHLVGIPPNADRLLARVLPEHAAPDHAGMT